MGTRDMTLFFLHLICLLPLITYHPVPPAHGRILPKIQGVWGDQDTSDQQTVERGEGGGDGENDGRHVEIVDTDPGGREESSTTPGYDLLEQVKFMHEMQHLLQGDSKDGAASSRSDEVEGEGEDENDAADTGKQNNNDEVGDQSFFDYILSFMGL